MKKVVICGNYGATNLGDEAILTGILKMLPPGLEIVVLSANPWETAKKYGVKSAHFIPTGIRSTLKGFFGLHFFKALYHIATCKMFILGGGGLFTDEKPHAIILWGIHAQFAYLFKKPVYMFAQSVGPLDSDWAKKAVLETFKKAALITVRDQESKDLLNSLGVDKQITVVPDPAFLMDVPQNRPERQEKYMILSVRPWIKTPQDLYKNLAQYVDWLYRERGIKALLLPFQEKPDNDFRELNKIFEQVGNREAVEILKWDSDLDIILGLFMGAEFVLGMRLHSLIFACLTETPMIGLVYSPKVKNFLRLLDLSENGLEMSDANLINLQKLTLEILSNNNKYKTAISKKLKSLKNVLTNPPILL